MKKAFLILGVVAVSAAAGGFTAWKVAAPREGSVQYIEREVERTPALGTHFTSYQAEQYPDLTYAAENAVKAVVNIEAVQQVEMPRRRGYDPFLEFFGIPQGYDEGPQFREQRAGGSGVIISEDGYVVTNNHVVDGASKLKVKLNDGRTFEAKLIGKDSATDLALLKIEAADLPTVPFGSSDALRLGEWVLAIGSPFDLQSTITAGIVSAKARNQGVITNDFRIRIWFLTNIYIICRNGNTNIGIFRFRFWCRRRCRFFRRLRCCIRDSRTTYCACPIIGVTRHILKRYNCFRI